MYGSPSRHPGGGRGRGWRGQNPNFFTPISILRREAVPLERVEAAVAKAWSDLLSAGQTVSTWKVSQSAALHLQLSSWDSVGYSIHNVPSLRNLQFLEGKVNAFIHCFVSTRRMTSVYELDIEICKSEGVERFEDLGLGPLLRYPLIQHYFLVPPDLTEICKITVEDLIGRLTVFQYRMKYKEFTVEEFLDFLVQKLSVASREHLGVRIQSMGMYIKFIRKIKRSEDVTFKSIQESGLPKEVLQSLSDNVPEHLDYLSTLTDNCPAENSKTNGTSEADDDGNGKSVHFFSLGSQKGKKGKGSCQSTAEFDEMRTIGMKLAIFKNKHDVKSYEVVQVDPVKAQRLTLTAGELDKFIANWEGACQKHSINEVLAMMLNIYKSSDKQKRKMERVFKSFPAVGLLNVAVRSIKFGEMKTLIEEFNGHVFLKASAAAHTEMVDTEPSIKDVTSKNENCIAKAENSESILSSTAEFGEMSTIGMKLAIFNNKNDNKSYEAVQVYHVNANKLTLTTGELDKFIANWEGACQKHSICEVLAMMLHIYKSSDKQKRKMERVFNCFPAVGLLNVAVRSIKFGEMKTRIEGHVSLKASAAAHTDMVDTEPSIEDVASKNENCIEKAENNISADDIIKYIVKYFESDHCVPRKYDLPTEEQLVVPDCEIWLSTQFSVKEFECLGHGSFLTFLEKYAFLFPTKLHHLMTEGSCQKSALEASMLEKQFLVLLLQATRYLGDRSVLTIQFLSLLLKKQFPTISFQIKGNDPDVRILDLVKNQKDIDVCSSVIFSMALLGSCNQRIAHKLPEESFKTKCELVGPLGSVSEKDAIECLVRAPKLSDLQSWSHWDLVFAPSFGPLLDWLLNMGPIEGLSCIVTSDGRIIRIDHSATLDEFLEASMQGSSLQAAVKLLSLLFAYDGLQGIPVSLLKCYCQRAFDVMINNCTTHCEASGFREILVQKSSLQRQFMHDADDDRSIRGHCISAELEGGHLCQDISQLKKAYDVVAIFIRDCLGYLPPEFRSAVADILVTVLQGFTKDASLIILSVCKLTNERVMLHDIGLSLGIVEWIEDYQAFISATAADLLASSPSLSSQSQQHYIEHDTCLKSTSDICRTLVDGENEANFVANSIESDSHQQAFCDVVKTTTSTEEISDKIGHYSFTSKDNQVQDAALLIETIRREEFGLDPGLANAEIGLLTKQHARLGRALHCLSQELYSQDSHFILELVQNADDNNYPEDVEPTLAFILLATGVVVMNNEHGFSAQNIRALCDVGSSTKKGSSAGYIGKKGIGFKSVFRVTDAPEIHSNGFHVKFDITDGQIGFVLPTIVSPCHIDFFEKQLSYEYYESDATLWNTCIVLPFNSRIKQAMGISPIISMFSDLHPSLLLFLNRLQCIKFKNMLDDKLVIMRRHILGDGIIRISLGDEEMSWLVVSKDLRESTIRPDVQNTKIAIAFTLQESDNGRYTAVLGQQPVFAFLPLRKYGLKFILQGDFVLPSSREEVDGDDAWNQWLLSEFPDLFVSSEKYFCALSCFKESPGTAVTAFMSFVPLTGEVHGFFSHLPHLILSRLRLSNCLLLDGPNIEWVPPCRVLRNWNEQARTFLPDALLQQHLGLGYLSKDIVLSGALAKALGIQEYGPTFLVGLLSSICDCGDGIKLMGLSWLSSFLDALYTYSNSMPVHSSGYLSSAKVGNESNFIDRLREISFIPLSDGSYDSLASGPIWLPCDAFSCKFVGGDSFNNFPALLAKLQTVTPLLFSADTSKTDGLGESKVDNLTRMLCKIGVRQLSAHDIIQIHIMPFISPGKPTRRDADMMVEYLTFIMIHFQSACSNCKTERADLILRLQKKPTVLTNHGFKCLVEEPIHFSKEFGNFIDIKKLIDSQDTKWNEVDSIYLKHPSSQSSSFGLTKWREFFQELGVTDFVQVKNNEKNVADIISSSIGGIPCYRDIFQRELCVTDWESPELDHLLLTISEKKCLDKSKYLLEVLDRMWDDYFWAKVNCYSLQNKDEIMPFESSFIRSIRSFKWVASSIDKEVHCPTDLFYDCEPVHLILGDFAPYAVPKVCSKSFLNDIGFRIQVTLDDSLKVLQYWIFSSTPSASISQMSKLYTFIRDELTSSTEKITEVRSCISVFVPLISKPGEMDVVPGLFLPPDKLYWHDPTGCLDKLTETGQLKNLESENNVPICMTLDNLYPGLHDFFVTACGVLETPPSHSYLQILIQLSRKTSPSQSAHQVFQVLLRFSDDLKSGILTFEEFCGLKESLLKLENTVLPTVQGKWVSLNSRFGLICWSDDEELMEQYVHLNDVYFLQFGKLTALEKEMLAEKVASLMRMIGIRSLTEVVSREPIFYGIADSKETASLIHWALPYAQRYLYQLHPDTYLHLKQNEFETLGQLQVIGVETLFYRFSLNGHCGTNMKRYECSCLLQGNILYITPYVDSHSMFLELSRLFFQGNPDLQMANFLHIITSMVEGSTQEQIESFVAKSQKIAELPAGQTLWCISSLLTANEISSPVCSSPMIANRLNLNRAKKRFTKLNWPPTNWKFSPDLYSASMIHVREKAGSAPAESKQKNSCKDPSNIMHLEDIRVPTQSDEKCFTKDNSITITPSISKGSLKVGQEETEPSGFIEKGITSCSETGCGAAHSIIEPSTELGMTCSSPIIQRNSLCLGIPEEEQSYKTGRVGEIIAYRYFSEKLGSTEAVRWVNEQSETGLPYDLIIEERGNTEYIEVKSTTSASKDWFPISPNEFYYASEKGDSYSIARVILSSPTNAEIFVLKNPLKLCQQNVLQLALLVPHGWENSIT